MATLKRKSRAAQGAAPRSSGRRPRARADLGNIRERIDAIDARIHALLNERARFAQLVGISKSASGKAVDFYRPEREAEVLRKALAAQSRAAARRGNRAAVPRDHVRLPRPAGAAQGGVPRPGGHVHPGRRAQAFRLLGARAAAARDRRGVSRSGRRHRGLRRGAHRELERGHGQPYARHVSRLRRSRSAARWSCASITT